MNGEEKSEINRKITTKPQQEKEKMQTLKKYIEIQLILRVLLVFLSHTIAYTKNKAQ